MDWFGTYELGSINVAAATSTSGGSGGRRFDLARLALGHTGCSDRARWRGTRRHGHHPASQEDSAGVSPIGRLCAIGAVVLAVVTIATWDRSEGEAVADGPTTPDAGAGRRPVAVHKGCALCHDGPDGTRVGRFPLAAAPSWAGDRRPGLSAEEYSPSRFAIRVRLSHRAWIGGGAVTETPQLGLTEAEIAASSSTCSTPTTEQAVHHSPSASSASSTPRWWGVDSASCVWLRITVSILAIRCSTSWR